MDFIGFWLIEVKFLLSYIIALKLALGKNNAIANELLKTLGCEGLNEFVEKGKIADTVVFDGLVGLNLTSSLRESLLLKVSTAEEIIERSEKKGIKIITILDEEYPTNLGALDNCPTVIYVRGNILGKYEKSIGCVGTRTPSLNAIRAIDSLVASWTQEGFTIISGLAEGVDTRSHEVCLEQGGTTIAVLAHGLDDVYPKKNEQLAERILNSGGLLISEYPTGMKAQRHTFIERNEWIVGLSRGVVVFEATIKSGTMHSVRFAQIQNKSIFCPIPLEPKIPQAEGITFLLNSKQAIAIKNKFEYGKVITALGYTIEHYEILRDYLVHADMKEHLSGINFYRDNNLPKRQIVLNIDEKLYEELHRVAESYQISVQDYFNGFRLAKTNYLKQKGDHKDVE